MRGMTEAIAAPQNDTIANTLARLLIIEDSLNDGELMIKVLRNCGYSVRQATTDNPRGLADILDAYPIDLALCSAAPRTSGLKNVRDAIKACGKDIPLIALAAEHNAEKHLEFMQAGACEVVCKSHLEHLQLVIRRELASLEIRRKLQISEQLIRESETRCRTLLDSSRDAIAYVHEGMHIHANAVYLNLFGFEHLQDIEGIPLMDMVASEDHAKLKEFLRRYRPQNKDGNELHIRGRRADGTAFDATFKFAAAAIDGEPCTQITIRDRRQDQELEKKLRCLSQLDPLTGLYNRQFFLDRVETSLQQTDAGRDGSGHDGSGRNGYGRNGYGAVLYLEPDNVKSVKEAAGIAGGDSLLSDIASLIRHTVTDSYVIARFGDFAFTVLTPKVGAEAAMALAEKLRATLENHSFKIAANSVSLTFSIGISLLREPSQDLDNKYNAQAVLSAADKACESAKQHGGNQWRLHESMTSQNTDTHNSHYWSTLIRDALSNNRLTLVYQPIGSLHLDTSEKYEVLLRMNDPKGNQILPGQFIPIAMEHNLLAAIDRWVILNTVKTLCERLKRGRRSTLFVKVSAASLADETLLPWLSKLLQKARLPERSIVFELTEEAVINHLGAAKTFVNGLQALECPCSLERFGVNKKFYELLRHLPVLYLKIDASYLLDLPSNKDNQAMIQAIADIAQASGKFTIAPFVEDASSLALLWQAGVDYLQGHFLQPPEAQMNFDFVGADG